MSNGIPQKATLNVSMSTYEGNDFFKTIVTVPTDFGVRIEQGNPNAPQIESVLRMAAQTGKPVDLDFYSQSKNGRTNFIVTDAKPSQVVGK